MKPSSRFAWITLLACLAIPALAQQKNVYMISNFGQPWDAATNEDAMDNIFGAGNWTTMNYETANPNSLLNPSTSFIFMEGGDTSFDSFQTFVANNLAAIQSWVSGGGRLLIMSAPNDPLTSADVTLPDSVVLSSDPYYGSAATQAYPVDRTNPIFSSPNQAGDFFTGNYFSHGYFSGNSNLVAILQSDLNEVVLAEDAIGTGLMVVGGLTTDNFQLPQPASHELVENIISYTALTTI